MSFDFVLQVLEQHGLSMLIVVFVGYMLYRYLIIKLEYMRKSLLDELKQKTFEVSGNVLKDQSNGSIEFKATVKEIKISKVGRE